MHQLRLLPIALSLLFLLPACRPPEDFAAPASPQGDSGHEQGREHKARKDKMGRGGGEGGGGDESRLSRNGLGKEDFALVQAELECVRGHYKDDETLRARAETAVYQRYGASEQWVDRVRVHMKSEGKYKGKIEDSVALRQEQVCPGGVVTAEMLAALDTLLRAEGGEGLLPDGPAKTDPPTGESPANDTAPTEEPADKPADKPTGEAE